MSIITFNKSTSDRQDFLVNKSPYQIVPLHDRFFYNEYLDTLPNPEFDNKILIEKAVNLREFKVPVLGKDNLFLGEIGEIDYHGKEIFDHEEKYLKEVDNLICTVDLSEEYKEKIYEYAKKAFKVLECSGMARVDFFLDKETEEIYINEVNTIPGFTKNSSYPKLLGKKGITEKDIIDKLIEYAINE